MNSTKVDPLPDRPLFHYTSLDGLLGIVKHHCLWATHIAHLNDSSELDYAVDLLKRKVSNVLREHDPSIGDRECLEQLQQWLTDRWPQNNLLFTCSFSEAGNLLSQWRAYCPPTGGVSLGFRPDELISCADLQGYQLVRCVYDRDVQQSLVDAWLKHVMATKDDQGQPLTQAHPTQSLYAHFRAHEEQFLQIATRIKNPAFAEEREWRLVSKASKDLRDPRLRFRVGRSRLVPYVEFTPPLQDHSRMSFYTVYVGPAQDPGLAFESVSTYMIHSNAKSSKGVQASGIPLRSW